MIYYIAFPLRSCPSSVYHTTLHYTSGLGLYCFSLVSCAIVRIGSYTFVSCSSSGAPSCESSSFAGPFGMFDMVRYCANLVPCPFVLCPWNRPSVEAAAASILDPFYSRLHGVGVPEASIPQELAAGFTPPHRDRRSAQEQVRVFFGATQSNVLASWLLANDSSAVVARGRGNRKRSKEARLPFRRAVLR